MIMTEQMKGVLHMFHTRKFGGYLSALRKKADMTQAELAGRLNLTRQAVSRYETGDSLPDVSILLSISEIFGVTVDTLVKAGEPTGGSIGDMLGLAPYLRPSTLAHLSEVFAEGGIDISHVVALAEYLNDESTANLLAGASFDDLTPELLERFLPMLDVGAKHTLLQRIIDGDMDWHFLEMLLPYSEYGILSLVEAGIMEGAFPAEALDMLRAYELRMLEAASANQK